MIPAVIGAVGLGLGAYRSIGQLMDNKRYWDDYKKNTGVSNRYYWRSGVGDWAGYGARSLASIYGISRFGYRPYRYINNRNHYHYHYYR